MKKAKVASYACKGCETASCYAFFGQVVQPEHEFSCLSTVSASHGCSKAVKGIFLIRLGLAPERYDLSAPQIASWPLPHVPRIDNLSYFSGNLCELIRLELSPSQADIYSSYISFSRALWYLRMDESCSSFSSCVIVEEPSSLLASLSKPSPLSKV